MSRAVRRASRAILTLLAATLLAGAPSNSGAQEVSRGAYEGRLLSAALSDLQNRGVRIIFSSDLVRPEMVVAVEPSHGSTDRLLDDLLGPHGLMARLGPRGSVLVVRRPEIPVWVNVELPVPGQAVFGEVEFSAQVASDERIARVEFFLDGRRVGIRRQRPYRIRVDVGGENVDRKFEVVAEGVWGATGRATTVTRKVDIQEAVEVSLKQLFVTVSRDSRPELDLGREDFRIVDNGIEETLVTFERGDVPITAVLLLDASESMRGQLLESALDGTRAFLDRTNPLDQAMIMLFSDRVLAATPFSADREALLAELEGVEASGGTALNDHLYASLRLLDSTQGRRVVILLSDGADVLSVLAMEDVLWKVRRTDALIYWIRLRDRPRESFSSAWRDFESNREEWRGLEKAVEESGGRVEIIEGVGEMEAAFESIMRELREQYVLGYYPSRRRLDGSWRRVRVRVNRPGTRVRFRPGYSDY